MKILEWCLISWVISFFVYVGAKLWYYGRKKESNSISYDSKFLHNDTDKEK